MARKKDPTEIIRCRCGELMRRGNYHAHWGWCRTPGASDVPVSDDERRAFIERFESERENLRKRSCLTDG